MRPDPKSPNFTLEVDALEKQLSNSFDEFTLLDNSNDIEIAKEITSNIGKIDLAIEGLSSAENQRDLSIKFHWGHNHRFNEEFSVQGRMGNRHLNLMSQFMRLYDLNGNYFSGKDVIDVGCWTGGTTLLLKMLGADNVLALEEVQKYSQTTARLIDLYKQANTISNGTNLYDLQSNRLYDVAYFPGVIYHLSDPVLALRRLYNALKDGGEIFVESAGLDVEEPICKFEGNRVFHKTSSEDAALLNRGGWNWYLPSPTCLERWMLEAGFVNTTACFSPVTKRVFGYGRREGFQEITRAGLSNRSIE